MILLGITGGIAAYKTVELARLFMRSGYQVQVVMTPAATHFVSPLTLKALTRRPVLTDPFTGEQPPGKITHVELAAQAKVLVVAPASANTVGKFAAGIADNLLTLLFMALRGPAVLVPSMNERMYESPAVQHNFQLLRSRGYHLMEADSGELASGAVGRGRMPAPVEIYNYVCAVLSKKDFAGIKVLVTAGPTREHLDPVRFLSSPSSGLMGYSLARAFAERGAEVNLVSGPTNLACPAGVRLLSVTTAEEMSRAVARCYSDCRVVVKAAAVADYRPLSTAPEKIKKGPGDLTLRLTATPDILKTLGEKKGNRFLVGFAAETGPVLEKARQKLARKNLDLIVANDVTSPGAGFASSTNQVTIIDAAGKVEEIPLMEKEDLAHLILDRIAARLAPTLPR